MEIMNFDLTTLFTLPVLFAIVLGTFVGLIIGALPGLGAVLAMVLLLPLTYNMEPLAAILLLLATYQAAEYGGSISAIILGIPGTPAALVTVFDGNKLARDGKPGKAIAYSLIASSIGGLVGGLALLFLSVPLAKFASNISSPEFFLIGLIGLLAIGALSSEDLTKGYISVILGLMAGTVGLDVITGESRFILGQIELTEGINLVALLVGMFGFSELFLLISDNLHTKYVKDKRGLKTNLSLKEIRGVSKPIGLGSTIGTVIGIIPGMGAGPSAWFAYSAAKSLSKTPEKYGTGHPAGIAAPESANNATVGGALIPLLSLGIPGSPSIAIIMGAFIIHGIQPGPTVFLTNPNLVYGIIFGFILTSISMFIIGKFVTASFTRILMVPNTLLIPLVLSCMLIGTYITRNTFFDVWIALGIGVITLILILFKYSVASFILAFVLSPIVEESLRRALLVSDGSYSIFFTRTYSLVLMGIIAIMIFTLIYRTLKNHSMKKKNNINI